LNKYGNPISVTRDEANNANRLLTSTVLTSDPTNTAKDKVVGADFYKTGVSDTTYYIGIDLDNSSGDYKHSSGSYISIIGAAGVLIKNKNSDNWNSLFGTILSIDGTQATVGWLQLGSMHALDTNSFTDRFLTETFPVEIKTSVSGGDYTYIAAGFKETTTSINTGITLSDLAGNNITPAAGDIVIKADKVTGTGNITIHYSFWYYTE